MTLSHISTLLPAAVPQRSKTPRTLAELLERFREEEALENPDVVVPVKSLRFLNDGNLAVPEVDGSFALTPWSKSQLASLVGVRWDRWFAEMSQEDQAAEINKRLWSNRGRLRVRTTRRAERSNGGHGTVRALVSPTFSPLPDFALLELLQTALEPVEPELSLLRYEATDKSVTYVIGVGRTFRPGDDHEVGDLWGGCMIRNSGCGFASVRIMASFMRLLCKNGMTAPVPDATLLHRAHRLFDLQKLRATLVERFRELPGKLANAAKALVAARIPRVDDPRAEFLDILRRARLPQKFLPEVERAYEAEPNLKGTPFGISQAATRAAQAFSAEERFDLERAAGEYVAGMDAS